MARSSHCQRETRANAAAGTRDHHVTRGCETLGTMTGFAHRTGV
jgi:hypothetical protein